MFKIKFAALLALALANGFAGEQTVKGLRDWITTEGIELQDPDGNPVDTKTLQITDAPGTEKTKRTLKVVGTTESSEGAGLPADFDTKVKAAAELALKNAGFDVSTPGQVKPRLAEVSGGERVEKSMYDAKIANGHARFATFERAKMFGAWFLSDVIGQSGRGAQMFGDKIDAARKWLKDNRLQTKAYSTNPNEGGVLLGSSFSPEVIRYVNDYGVFARSAKVMPMDENSVTFFQRTETLGLTYQADGTAPTALGAGIPSNFTPRVVTAKLGLAHVQMSKVLMRDSVVALADAVVEDLSRSAAYQEDLNGYLGDGSSTYGGQVGIIGAIAGAGGSGLTAATAYSGNNVNQAGTGASAWTGYDIGHFEVLMGKIHPAAWASGRVRWQCHSRFYFEVMLPIALAAGRSTATEVVNGVPQYRFLGLPVDFVQVMNSTGAAASGTVDCLLGDFAAACILGRRQDVEININDSVAFTQYAIMLQVAIQHGQNVLGAVGTTAAPGIVGFLYQT